MSLWILAAGYWAGIMTVLALDNIALIAKERRLERRVEELEEIEDRAAPAR